MALRGRPPHAILLSGVAGLEIPQLADEFAASLLCEAPGDAGACGKCPACNWFALGNHPDYRLLRPDADAVDEDSEASTAKGKPSKEIRIEQVRTLGDFLNVGTHRAGHRVIVIQPAEVMNRNTANALLKSLEEPAPGTVFILVTSEIDALLPTLRSRCQNIPVPLPERKTALRWLAAHGVGEAARWLDRAGGAPALARDIAGGAEGRLLALLEDLFSRPRAFDSRSAAAEVEKLLRAHGDIEMIAVVNWTQRWIVDETLTQRGLPPRYFVDLAPMAHRRDINLHKINAESVEFKKLSQHTLNNRLFLENFFDRCCAFLPKGTP
jgi:DNA polymerase-3 subunit delta'